MCLAQGHNPVTPHMLFICIKSFCGFSIGRNQYWVGRVYDLCVYYMTGTPEGSAESGFMEMPGIEHATPGLQGTALIHYTTGAFYMYQKGIWVEKKTPTEITHSKDICIYFCFNNHRHLFLNRNLIRGQRYIFNRLLSRNT